MGPSGSGKSTLLHCIAGLDTLTSGSAYIGEVRLGDLNDRQLTLLRREKVGFVFQAFNLIPTLDASENITLPIDIAGGEVDRAWFDTVVDTIGLRDRLRHRPAELSGGQVQRVAAAGRWSPGRRSSSPTSPREPGLQVGRRADALPAAGSGRVRADHRDGHPRPKVAAFSDRVVFLADGRCIDEMEDPTAESILTG